MRLLEFRIPDFKGGRGIAIPFETQRRGAPSLAFLVGPNGSGKSRLLEALGQVFAHLSSGIPPGFRFELEYELTDGRVLLSTERSSVEELVGGPLPAPLQEVGGWLLRAQPPFEGWERNHLEEAWPTYLKDILPFRVLGVSSGPTSRLDWALRQSVASSLSQRLPAASAAEAAEVGRDPSLDIRSEEEMVRAQLQRLTAEPRTLPIDGPELILAIFALMSHPLATRGERPMRDAILEKAGLSVSESLRAVSFDVPPDWPSRLPVQHHRPFRDFVERAAQRLAVPREYLPSRSESSEAEEDVRCVFVFDESLEEWIGQTVDTPFFWLTHLQSWAKVGALRGPRLTLTARHREGLLRDRDLSDGELLIVGRYSLLLLLEDHDDCLVLFDEPETHFNDRWKIDLVHDLEQILSNNSAQVLIATHSDLTLTDADRSDVFVLPEDSEDGETVPEVPVISPLGADRNEISRYIFGAEAASGKRAREIVDEALASRDLKRVEEAIARVGPGYQEFRLRYLAERLKDDAP